LSTGVYKVANKAFLFALSGGGISSPCKMKLKDANHQFAIYCGNGRSTAFGAGHDMFVDGSNVFIKPGHSYDSGPLTPGGS
jgi:hypothetical protein